MPSRGRLINRRFKLHKLKKKRAEKRKTKEADRTGQEKFDHEVGRMTGFWRGKISESALE